MTTFFHLLDLVPTTEELDVDLDPFLSYFQTNWITGVGTVRRPVAARYPPPTWTAVDRTISRLNRTNNFVEAWNNAFASIVGHSNPTIWNLLSAIFLEQSSTDEKHIHMRIGDDAPRRKKRHVTKDIRVLHLVDNFDADRSELLGYLDSLSAVLSC